MIVGIREMSRPEAFISVTDIDGRNIWIHYDPNAIL